MATPIPTLPPSPTGAPSASPIYPSALLNIPEIYLYPVYLQLDGTTTVRSKVDNLCTANAPNHGDYYGFPSLDCEKAFAFLSYSTDSLLQTYAQPHVFGSSPNLPFSASAPVVDRYSRFLAANWSVLWNNGTLLETLGNALPQPVPYALGIFQNGSIAPNCNNWFGGASSPGGRFTTQILTGPQSRTLTSNLLDLQCNTTISFFCVCLPPGPPTLAPTSKSPSSRAPSRAPSVSAPPPPASTNTYSLPLGLAIGLGIPAILLLLIVGALGARGRAQRQRAL